jgi:hypothetical protein
VSLHAFLTHVFPPTTLDASIHLCSFPGAPNGPWCDWTGFRYRRPPHAVPMSREDNQYFCIGVLDPKSTDRLASHVIGSPIIALDDVGTSGRSKVKPGLVTALLTDKGLRATAVIETSRDNFSLIYRVAAPDEPDQEHAAIRLGALRKRLADLGLTDPSCVDPVRYMRLPWGVNGKDGFRVRLRLWAPGVPVARFEQWTSALWSDRAMERAAFDAMSGSTRFHVGDRAASLHDPLVKLAAEVGLDPHETRPGVIEADCPFWEEHSTAGDKSGFAFVNWGRCHCHHGHCASRRSIDFQTRMIEMYDRQIALDILSGALRWTSDDTLLLDQAGDAVAASGLSFLSVQAFALADDADVLIGLYGEPPEPSRAVAAVERRQ